MTKIEQTQSAFNDSIEFAITVPTVHIEIDNRALMATVHDTFGYRRAVRDEFEGTVASVVEKIFLRERAAAQLLAFDPCI